ncbi:MAG: type II toxin-antitoxin system HicB family antitoxin [Nitrososphaerales archaeon]
MALRDYTVKIWKGEDGYYVVQCVELPAAISQGKTREEALENIREAIEVTLEGLKRDAARSRKELIKIHV